LDSLVHGLCIFRK